MIRLEMLRKEKGLSQEAFAKKINMTQQRISSYEKGIREPDLETLKTLATFFDVSIDFLTGNSDIRKTDKRNNDIDLTDIRIAQHNGIDTNGLSEEDIEEIKRQVEFMKWKKGNKK